MKGFLEVPITYGYTPDPYTSDGNSSFSLSLEFSGGAVGWMALWC